MLATTSAFRLESPVFCISAVTAIRCECSPTNFACACGKIPIPCGTLLFRIFLSDYLRPPASLHLLHLQDEQSAKVRSKFLNRRYRASPFGNSCLTLHLWLHGDRMFKAASILRDVRQRSA